MEEGAMDGAGGGVAEEGCSGEEREGVADVAVGGGGGEGEQEGRTLVVGVRADAASRTLLTWTFINVAAPGDRIVAVHVVLASAPVAAATTAVDFDTMLAVYEGFCNLKQV